MKSYANATNLKYVAIIFMVFDHIHQMFLNLVLQAGLPH